METLILLLHLLIPASKGTHIPEWHGRELVFTTFWYPATHGLRRSLPWATARVRSRCAGGHSRWTAHTTWTNFL